MASPLSSASQRELSTGTKALPSWSLIDTDVPAKGVVRIVRSRDYRGEGGCRKKQRHNEAHQCAVPDKATVMRHGRALLVRGLLTGGLLKPAGASTVCQRIRRTWRYGATRGSQGPCRSLFDDLPGRNRERPQCRSTTRRGASGSRRRRTGRSRPVHARRARDVGPDLQDVRLAADFRGAWMIRATRPVGSFQRTASGWR
jgi:hypothetical protein